MDDGSEAIVTLDSMQQAADSVAHSFDLNDVAASLTTCSIELGDIQQMQIAEQQASAASAASKSTTSTTSTSTDSAEASDSGTALASWYDDEGLSLGYGSVYGVAHKTLAKGTQVRFTYGCNSVTCVVSDRGPYIAGRMWDLNRASASALGIISAGVATVGYTIY
jgi:rare lipoprotein A